MNDTWLVVEPEFEPQRLHHQETVFTIGNGYLGTRGTFEEGYPGAWPATLVNGVYDAVPVGRVELANVPDWLPLSILVEGERFGLERGEVLRYRRTLNLRTGVLSRHVCWRSPGGRTLDLHFERFASLADPHVLAIRCRITPLDSECEVEVRAALDRHVDNRGYVHWDRVDHGDEGNQIWLHCRTRTSGIDLAEAALLVAQGGKRIQVAVMDCLCCPTLLARDRLQPGQTMRVDKLGVIYTSREEAEPLSAARRHLKNLSTAGQGYDQLLAAHQVEWEKYWAVSDIVIVGDDEAQRAIRFSLFQLLAAAPRHDERVSIPAKALSGFA